MWRKLAQETRCLVFADGFYEPKGEKGKEASRPWHFFQFADERIFAFGGLWKQVIDRETGEIVAEGFVIITTDATDEMRPIHHRHPLILRPDQWAGWLDHKTNNSKEFLDSIVSPWAGDPLSHWQVSNRPKSAQFDDKKCIEPDTDKQEDLFA